MRERVNREKGGRERRMGGGGREGRMGRGEMGERREGDAKEGRGGDRALPLDLEEIKTLVGRGKARARAGWGRKRPESLLENAT